MVAKEDQVDDLRAALANLAGKVKLVPGCEGVEVYQESRTPARFHFIERWSSIDAHRAAGQHVGKEASAAVSAAVAEPPQGAYLDLVSLGN